MNSIEKSNLVEALQDIPSPLKEDIMMLIDTCMLHAQEGVSQTLMALTVEKVWGSVEFILRPRPMREET